MTSDKETGLHTQPDGPSEPDCKSDDQTATQLSIFARAIPVEVLRRMRIVRDHYDHAYLRVGASTTVYDLEQQAAETQVLRLCAEAGVFLRPHELKEIMAGLRAYAQLAPLQVDVFDRVAVVPNGILLNVGDDLETRIELTPGRVEVKAVDARALFAHSSAIRPLPIPAAHGNLGLLDQYLNLHELEIMLLKAHLTYVLGHAKVPGVSFPILILGGDQGSGKTLLCRLVQALIDPSNNGVQAFPRGERDLAITTARSHLVIFDNVRNLAPTMADLLCIVATGGTLPTRRLYSNAGQYVHRLHAAVVLNSVHSFVDQSDFAQRCVYLTVRPLSPSRRRSEAELMQQFHADLPKIFRGLLDLIAAVLIHLPEAEPTEPERLYEFSRWLAAMERVENVPTGVFQAAYSANLCEGMLDALLEDPLAAAVVALIESEVGQEWSGTPAHLLETLGRNAGRRTLYSPQWPQTPSALSKRLQSLQVGLQRLGIGIRFTRGRERRITLTLREGSFHE